MTPNKRKKGGPKTESGKKISSANATRHAILSQRPVVEGMESEEDWHEHREGVLRELNPQGHLEDVLTTQVASLLWRRNRVVRYETEVIAPSQEEAERKIYKLRRLEEARSRERFAQVLPSLSDDDAIPLNEALAVFFQVVDVLSENDMYPLDLEAIPLPNVPEGASRTEVRWTAGGFREAVTALAGQTAYKPENLLDWAMGIPRLGVREAEREAKADALVVEGPLEEERGRIWGERLLPDEKVIDKIARYEAHLGRELNRTLDQLKALRQSK